MTDQLIFTDDCDLCGLPREPCSNLKAVWKVEIYLQLLAFLAHRGTLHLGHFGLTPEATNDEAMTGISQGYDKDMRVSQFHMVLPAGVPRTWRLKLCNPQKA